MARHQGLAYARLERTPQGVAFISSYDAGLVAALKEQIPPGRRRWDQANKRWLIDPADRSVLEQLTATYLGVTLEVPLDIALGADAPVEERVFYVEYIGRCKDRGDGQSFARALSNGNWDLVLPEDVLAWWMYGIAPTPQAAQQPQRRPAHVPTLYEVLAVQADAPAEEVKRAYRRAAMQTHPDRNKEPDAMAQFQAVQRAWEVLCNPQKRRLYDLGRNLEAKVKIPAAAATAVATAFTPQSREPVYGLAPPKRCGILKIRGRQETRGFVAQQILSWTDITRPGPSGTTLTLVTHFDVDSTTVIHSWV